MKFLDKKEQVYDIKLTPHGKLTLSMGTFEPVYYAFFDENIIYDSQYAGSPLEEQNNIHKRIKEETAYLESQVRFSAGASGKLSAGAGLFDESFILLERDQNIYTSDSFIGDARLLSADQQVAPAWKVIAMQGDITEVRAHPSAALTTNTDERAKIEGNITQIDVTANYSLSPTSEPQRVSFENIRDTNSTSRIFSDGSAMVLESADPLFYVEELNTELLSENYDIEVFAVEDPDSAGMSIRRLFFKDRIPQVVDGMMVSPTPQSNDQELDETSVEHYFTIEPDHMVDPKIACRRLNQFNSEDYLIELDFDCEEEQEDLYYDIYGRVTESEICPD